jgi:hypothetical protein
MLDALLPEAVGRERVPDLAARVTARLEVAASGCGPRMVRWPRRRTRALPIMLGALAGAAAAFFVSTRLGAWRQMPEARAVAWHVVDGCLEWQGGHGGGTAHGGDRASWPLAAGDRLRTCEQNPAVCDIVSLGRLHMTKGTEIEVAAMEWKSFAGGSALGALTVAVVAGAIRWSSGGEVAQAHIGESLELRAASPVLAAAKVDELTRRVSELEQELSQERTRARELEARAGRTVAANAAQTAAAEGAAGAAPPPLQPAVSYAGMEPALAAVDWDVTGKCMHEMTQRLDEVFAALEKGEEMPLELLGEVQKLNAELIKQAGAVVKADVPGTSVNGKFTHPVIAANQVHATLVKAGLPLSNAQRDALQQLSAQVAGEDDARRSALGEEEFELADVLGETALKDRFYQEARQILTPEQERALFPSRLAGTPGNLFDTGLVWAPLAKSVAVRDRADLAAKMAEAVTRQAGLGDDLAPRVREAVETWARALPEDAIAAPDPLAGTGLGKIGPVRDAAARQLALLREISRSLPLTAAQKQKLRKLGPVYLPRRIE